MRGTLLLEEQMKEMIKSTSCLSILPNQQEETKQSAHETDPDQVNLVIDLQGSQKSIKDTNHKHSS